MVNPLRGIWFGWQVFGLVVYGVVAILIALGKAMFLSDVSAWCRDLFSGDAE